MLFLDGKRIKENLKKHKRDERRHQRERHRRPHKRRKLNSGNQSAFDGDQRSRDDRSRRRKRDKDRKRRGHREKEKDNENGDGPGDSDLVEYVEYLEDAESDPYRGLPYHWHLAAHCEPDIPEHLHFTDIKRLLDPTNSIKRYHILSPAIMLISPPSDFFIFEHIFVFLIYVPFRQKSGLRRP